VIVLDDIEPDESNYSEYQMRKRLVTLLDTVLPMNERAHVALVGTVTMPGSIVHQLVRSVLEPGYEAPAWIAEQRFRVHYFDPIIKTDDGRERSLWPAKWPLAYLESIRHTRSFRKNFKNLPVRLDGDYWNEHDFVYGDVQAVRTLLQIDPAVTDKRTSDYYGLSVIAHQPAERAADGRTRMPARCAVRYARQFRMPPAKLREKVLQLLEQFPEIGAVRIETNQGGDTWRAILHDLPVRLLVVHETVPKPVRATNLLNHYQRGRVLHARKLPEVEDQMTSYPDVLHDDLIDSVGAGVAFFLDRKKPARASAKAVEYA
jgi:phage terminase large subunit-like protein